MKYLNTYKLFESKIDNQFFQTYKETKDWLEKTKIKNYIINNDLTVDDDVIITKQNLIKIPVQFNTVKGFFDCSNNALVSLKGSPKNLITNDSPSIDWEQSLCGFYCNNNQLKTLEYCPKYVGVDFLGFSNNIINFNGFPDLDTIKRIDLSYNPVHEFMKKLGPNDGWLYANDDHNKLRIKLIGYLIEHNVLKDNKIIIENLKEVLYMMDLKLKLNSLKNLKDYIIIE